jgi:hypothetical protein
MSNITVYKSEYITVEYWPDKKLIFHTIHQPMSAQLAIFKEALNAGTEALEKYQLHKWLSDDRKNDPLTPEGNDWAFNDWQPRTLKAGWKYWAAVVPQSLAAAGTMVPVINGLFQLGLRMMVFTNSEEAIQWLDTMENPSE